MERGECASGKHILSRYSRLIAAHLLQEPCAPWQDGLSSFCVSGLLCLTITDIRAAACHAELGECARDGLKSWTKDARLGRHVGKDSYCVAQTAAPAFRQATRKAYAVPTNINLSLPCLAHTVLALVWSLWRLLRKVAKAEISVCEPVCNVETASLCISATHLPSCTRSAITTTVPVPVRTGWILQVCSARLC